MTPIMGAQIANDIKNRLREENAREGLKPSLAVILVGDQPDSSLYVTLKEKAVDHIGGHFRLERLSGQCDRIDILGLINSMNEDPEVDGIILQLPLPGELGKFQDEFLEAISPGKDVDGFNPHNRGLLLGGQAGFVSCAALACMEVIQGVIPVLKGIKVNLVGDSFDLIMPLALLLLREQCRIGLFPEFTGEILNNCDILVIENGGPAVVREIPDGGPGLLIDAGFYMLDGRITGNASQKDLAGFTGQLLPVPGGLGPILIAKLMENLNLAARRA